MCLAIFKPADTAPDWTAYENGFDDNPHSWGFAAVKDGELITRWGLGKFDEFRTDFEPFADCKAIIHFRWATHGGKILANCHPFHVAPDLAMIHNGIVSIDCNVNRDRSDTWHFNELVLKPMHAQDPDFFLRPEHRYTQQLAHRGSKFCFLRADGMHEIWCEDDGVWEKDGHWYSNTGYRTSRKAWYYGGSYKKSSSVVVNPHRDVSPKQDDDTLVMTEREIEIDLEQEQYDLIEEQDARAAMLRDPYADDAHEQAEIELEFQRDQLLACGFSKSTLKEVYDVLGAWGIEVLYDCI